jgi:hypothetical protein
VNEDTITLEKSRAPVAYPDKIETGDGPGHGLRPGLPAALARGPVRAIFLKKYLPPEA